MPGRALQINILNADKPADIQDLTRPSADDFGAQGFRAATLGAEAIGHQLSIYAQHERQAIIGSLAAQAEAEYVGATAQMTDRAYTEHPQRPDLAHQQALAFMQIAREKVIKKYAQDDQDTAATITQALARHDIVTLPKLQQRTTTATVKNALDAAAANRAAGIQTVVGATTPDEVTAGLDQIVGGTMHFAGNALSHEQARNDVQVASQTLADQLTTKQERTQPLAILNRLQGLTMNSPELEGLSYTQKQEAINQASKTLADAMIARHQTRGDLLAIDTQTALARGLLTGGDFLRVEKARGATRDDAVLKATKANAMSEDEVLGLRGQLSADTFAHAMDNVHAAQDRIRQDQDRKDKAEKQEADQRDSQIRNGQFDALMNGTLTARGLDLNFSAYTGHDAEYRIVREGLRKQQAAGGLGDERLFRHLERKLILGKRLEDEALMATGLNWDQSRALFDTRRKQDDHRKADHWSQEPSVQRSYSVLANEYGVKSGIFSETGAKRRANIEKMWNEGMDAAARRGLKGEDLGKAARDVVEGIERAFPTVTAYKDLPQPSHPTLKAYIEAAASGDPATRLSSEAIRGAIHRALDEGRLKRGDPAIREEILRTMDILDNLDESAAAIKRRSGGGK